MKVRKLTTMERASLKRCYPDKTDEEIENLGNRATQKCKKERAARNGGKE